MEQTLALVWRAVNRFKATRKRCTAGFSSVDEKSIFSDHIHWPPFPFFNAREADSWGSLPRRGWTAAKGVFDEGFLGLQRKWWKKFYYHTHRCEKIARCKKGRKRGNGGRGGSREIENHSIVGSFSYGLTRKNLSNYRMKNKSDLILLNKKRN